jgi:hypothetical protein
MLEPSRRRFLSAEQPLSTTAIALIQPSSVWPAKPKKNIIPKGDKATGETVSKEETANSISFLNLSEETQRKLRGDDEDPFEDQPVIINTQQELRRSARLVEQSQRRTAEALKLAEQKEREESIQLKIAGSIRNQSMKGVS